MSACQKKLSAQLQDELRVACNVLSSLSGNEVGKNAVREQGGSKQLLRLLGKQNIEPSLATSILRAITILVTDSEANQEHFQQEKSLSVIVNYLDVRISTETTAIAVVCLTGQPAFIIAISLRGVSLSSFPKQVLNPRIYCRMVFKVLK